LRLLLVAGLVLILCAVPARAAASPEALAPRTGGAGLSAERAQLWHQGVPDLPDDVGAADLFGKALAGGDFDGDGRDDLAIGVSGETVGGLKGAGAVVVLYGTNAGLSGARAQLWHQEVAGVADDAWLHDFFGFELAAGDFDGDGRDDLAIGAPIDDPGGVTAAGVVNVLYGSAAGLTAEGNQVWHQDTAGMEDEAEVDDAFGLALAAGDFNGDGRDDLAVGVPSEDIGTVNAAGAVAVLYGSASGLTAAGNQFWHLNVAGVDGAATVNDHFGSALAAGDFNGDGQDDLAIGVPFDQVDGAFLAGSANVLYGSASGLSAASSQVWHQNNAGAGAAAEDDMFGSALTAGDFDGDGLDDLAVGVPGEDEGDVNAAGAVNVLYGSQDGLRAGGQLWRLSAGPSAPGAQDLFGKALAAGDVNGDGKDDLAIGAPGRHVDGEPAAGAVVVLRGSPAGITSINAQLWDQDSSGAGDPAESGDRFGDELATGDFDGDGAADLAVGVALEDIGNVSDAGAVVVLYGVPTARVGDVDCSRSVTSIDAALVLQLVAGLISELPCPAAANVDGAGGVTAIDAALILQHVAGLIPSLPP
jgi:hypothetical protein